MWCVVRCVCMCVCVYVGFIIGLDKGISGKIFENIEPFCDNLLKVETPGTFYSHLIPLVS